MIALVLAAATVVAETQLYPVREQARGYLGRYVDQPLFLDRTIEVRGAYDGGRYSQGDLDTYRRWAKEYGIDGFSTFTWSRPSVAEACRRSPVQGLVNVHFFMPAVRSEKMEASIRTALDDPNALKRDGKVVLLAHEGAKMKSVNLKSRYDEIRAAYGDRCLFVTDTPRLAHHLYRNTFRETGRLDPAQVAELKDHLREYLRVSDGLYVTEQWVTVRIVDSERVFDAPFYRTVLKVTREVLDEPEFVGKLLAVAVPNGHENAYTRGYLVSSNGTRTFRETFEAGIEARADIFNLFEWDEWNENTSALPTLYNSTTCKRLVRHYLSRLRGTAETPIPGDDTSVPNLIVSYRRQLDAVEPFYVEVLNVPDGSWKGVLSCGVRLTDAGGRTLYSFSRKNIDAATLAEARFSLPSGEFAKLPPVFRVAFDWAQDGDEAAKGVVYDGLLPVDRRAGAGWMHKCVKQPLRELAKMSRAEVALTDEGKVVAELVCSEPIRYAMLCGDGLIQYIHSPDDLVSRFRSMDETAVFAIAPIRWKSLAATNLSYRVQGVSKAEWLMRLDAPTVCRGESVRIPELSAWQPSHYVAVPKAKVDTAVLTVDFSEHLKAEFPLSDVMRTGGLAQGGSNGLEVAVSPFRRQAAYPAVWNRTACAFAVRPDLLGASGVFYVQVVTMSGKTWRSNPLTLGDLSARVCLDYDFSPRAGDAVWPKSGERRFVGMAGGPFQLLTQFNRGATAEGPLDSWTIAALATGQHDTHPRRERTPKGDWAFVFDGQDDYLGFPQGTIPPNAGFTLSFDVFPERELDEEFILGARNEGGGSLWGVQLRKGRLRLDYMGLNYEHTSFPTGLKVETGKWNHVEIVKGVDKLTASVNGQTVTHACHHPGRNYTAFAVGGDGRQWFKGKIANLKIVH